MVKKSEKIVYEKKNYKYVTTKLLIIFTTFYMFQNLFYPFFKKDLKLKNRFYRSFV